MTIVAASVKAQCDAYLKRLDERRNVGLTALAVEFKNQLFDDLNEKQAQIVGSEYKGSGPGDPPAVFERWFTKHLVSPKVEGGLAMVGFNMKHANTVYRILVHGTKDIEPRKGPKQLFDEIKPFLVESFRAGFCSVSSAPAQDVGLDGF